MATTPNPFVDFTTMLQQFKLPGVDMSAIIEARRKDIDALMESNKIAYEGMQALAQKQAEILRTTMEEMQASAKGMAAGGNPMANAGKQGEVAQQAVQKAFANMRELAEMARKSQTEAFTIINQRAMQNIEDMKKLMQPK
jgi:phasin family protein